MLFEKTNRIDKPLDRTQIQRRDKTIYRFRIKIKVVTNITEIQKGNKMVFYVYLLGKNGLLSRNGRILKNTQHFMAELV